MGNFKDFEKLINGGGGDQNKRGEGQNIKEKRQK